MNNQAVIIGAGLTGLTTAYYLKKAGWQVHILEKKNIPGGSICTHHENDFVFESGPNTGIISKPEVAQLLKYLKKEIKIEIHGDYAGRRLIWKDCRWYVLPNGLLDFLKTPLLNWNEKLKLFTGIFRKKMFRFNMDNKTANNEINYFDPFIHAVYSGDFLVNTSRVTLDKICYSNYQFLYPFIKPKGKFNNGKFKLGSRLFFIEGGFSNLIKALVNKIGETQISYEIDNITVYPDGNNFNITYKNCGIEKTKTVPVIISTVGAEEICKIFQFLSTNEKENICKLPYINVVQAVVGFHNWRGIPLKAYGGLIPANENRNIHGILFPSSFLKKRAPEKGASISVFLGGINKPEVINYTDDEIKTIVMKELRSMLLIPDKQPELFRIFRHHSAFPPYKDFPEAKLNTISAIERQFPGLVFAGNMQNGIGMANRVCQGALIAEKIAHKFN